MTRRKCMANIIAVVMVMLISMASLIEELKGAGDKVEIFRIALIPGLADQIGRASCRERV